MSRTNTCFVVGNVGADPIERGKTEKGPVVAFSIAENVQAFDSESRTYKTLHTNWFNVTAFGFTGERARSALKKGDRVAIQGKMKMSKYKDRSGEERTGFEIIADEIALYKTLPSAGSKSQPGQAGQPDLDDADRTEEIPF